MLSVFAYPRYQLLKFGMYITAPEPTSAAHFINPSHQPVCLYVYSPLVIRQRFGKKKNVTAAMNTQATIEELLGMLFSLRSVSY
jgi:hypothetical protein